MNILVTLKNTTFNLEANTTFSIATKLKNFMYATYGFSTNIKPGEPIHSSKIKPFIQINFVWGSVPSANYVLTDTKNPNHTYLENFFQIKVINIEKYAQKDYNENEKLRNLFRFLSSKTKEEAKEVAKGDELLMKMYEKAYDFTNGAWAKQFFGHENYQNWLHEDELELKFNEGIELGMSKGISSSMQRTSPLCNFS